MAAAQSTDRGRSERGITRGAAGGAEELAGFYQYLARYCHRSVTGIGPSLPLVRNWNRSDLVSVRNWYRSVTDIGP